MAEIHCIAPSIGEEQAQNLGVSLSALLAQDIDPGPRDAQIRSLGRTLTRSVRDLREQLARLGVPDAVTGLDLDRLERAARLAAGYDPDGNRSAA